MEFGCRPDRGRDTCRSSASAPIVSQRLRYRRRFYLRPKFRQLQRLLGPALVFTDNFDRNVFDFCELSPKDFNNKAPGRAAHPGFGGGLSMNAEGVPQTAYCETLSGFGLVDSGKTTCGALRDHRLCC